MGGTTPQISGQTSSTASSAIGGVTYGAVNIGAPASKNTVWLILGGAAVVIAAIFAFTFKRS